MAKKPTFHGRDLIVYVAGDSPINDLRLVDILAMALSTHGFRVYCDMPEGGSTIINPAEGPVHRARISRDFSSASNKKHCECCGRDYSKDLMVSDDLWEKIKPTNKPKGAGLLCPTCTVERAAVLEGWATTFFGGGIK